MTTSTRDFQESLGHSRAHLSYRVRVSSSVLIPGFLLLWGHCSRDRERTWEHGWCPGHPLEMEVSAGRHWWWQLSPGTGLSAGPGWPSSPNAVITIRAVPLPQTKQDGRLRPSQNSQTLQQPHHPFLGASTGQSGHYPSFHLPGPRLGPQGGTLGLTAAFPFQKLLRQTVLDLCSSMNLGKCATITELPGKLISYRDLKCDEPCGRQRKVQAPEVRSSGIKHRAV